jgi:hypothetical protein
MSEQYFMVRVVEQYGDYEFPSTFIAVICNGCGDDEGDIKACVAGWRDDYADVIEDPEDVFTGPSGVVVNLTHYHKIDKYVHDVAAQNNLLPIIHI